MDLKSRLQHYIQRTETLLAQSVAEAPSLHPRLQAAMRYSLLNGGKRIRPALVYLACDFCGGSEAAADWPAAAIEALHSYSLVHDDLPAMDNDALRRGVPTCHIAFDEATAILAGDALLNLAFELLSEARPELYTPAQQLQLLATLAQASGHRGMVVGQAFDLAHVGQALTLEQLEQMHAHKTGALILAALQLGAQAAAASEQELAALTAFGRAIGLAFQVKDDLLDIEGCTEVLGKPSGSDLAQNKPTYPALLGLQGAKEKLQTLHQQANAALSPFGSRAEPLLALAQYIVERDH